MKAIIDKLDFIKNKNYSMWKTISKGKDKSQTGRKYIWCYTNVIQTFKELLRTQ